MLNVFAERLTGENVKRKPVMQPHHLYEYYAISVPRRCPICGSESLIVDIARGQVVCTSCGYVIDELVFETSLSLNHGDRGPPLRLPSVEARRAREWLSVTTARAKLVSRLGSHAETIVEGMASDPHAAGQALRLLTNPCIKKFTRRISNRLKAAIVKAIIKYIDNGEYPLYSELALEHDLSPEESRRLRRLIRKVISCIEAEEPLKNLITSPT